MKSVVLYYTFGGSTKQEAEKIGAEQEAPVYRVKEKRNRSLIGSFIPGGMQAMKRKRSKILPLEVDLSAFDRIYIGGPVWAACPAPVSRCARPSPPRIGPVGSRPASSSLASR